MIHFRFVLRYTYSYCDTATHNSIKAPETEALPKVETEIACPDSLNAASKQLIQFEG
jgi:hypothetical protein